MPVTYSPLRYPGGKTKLYGLVCPLIRDNVGDSSIYVEPFAGGAGLGLKLLFRKDVSSLILNDIDENIYTFWHSCLYETDALCRMIQECAPSIAEWDKQRRIYKEAANYSPLERGFATLFLNRCNVSGVISGGPIGGRNQEGKYHIDARFNSPNLIRKIQEIGKNADRISFYNMDAAEFLQTVVSSLPIENTFINIDPPYVKKGPLLYRNSFSEGDHEKLNKIIMSLRHKWITTYDKCDLIQKLYKDYRISEIVLNYSAGEAKKGEALLILCRDLRIEKLP